MHQMHEGTPATSVTHRTGALDFAGWTGEVKLSRVLHQQSHVLFRYPSVGSIDVRSQDVIEIDFVVVKETISGDHFRSVVTSSWNTGGGRLRERIEQLHQPTFESLIA